MSISWGRILVYGAGFEILTLPILDLVLMGQLGYEPSTLVLSSYLFLGLAVGGWWVGSKASSNKVLQGGLVGVASAVAYVVITTPFVIAGKLEMTYDFLYFWFHGIKILGGASGGLLALTLAKSRVAAR
jgi:hypothetical protein